jgi:hypothetical protein
MENDCLVCSAPMLQVMDGVFDTRFGIETPYVIAKCKDCNLEQTAPLPNQDGLNALYEKYYNFSGEKNTRYTQLRAKFINSFLYRVWLAIDGDISFHLARKFAGCRLQRRARLGVLSQPRIFRRRAGAQQPCGRGGS